MSLKTFLKKCLGALPIRVQCRLNAARSGAALISGKGSFIHPSVHLLGKENIRVGSNTCISEGSWLNVNHRRPGDTAISIGDNCFIGKQNFFTSGKAIVIGDYTLTTIGCKFIGSSHHIDNPNVPYLLSGTTEADEIRIGANCFIGAGATVLGNVSIGHGSVVGAGAMVLADVPPFSLVVGSPAKVVKRFSFPQNKWTTLSDFSAADEAALPPEHEYLAHLTARFGKPGMPWMAAGKSMGDL